MRSVVLLALLAVTAPLGAQQRPVIGVGLSASTMGIGVDGAIQVTPRLGVRGRLAFMPYEPEFSVDDIDYAFELPSPQAGLFADLFLAGPLRLTGGLRYSAKDLAVSATLAGPVDIGDQSYTPAEIGTLTGGISTNKVGPYIGLGLGRVAGRGVGIFFDAGVAFHGSPEATLTAAGGTLSNQAAFQTELNKEIASINDDIDGYSMYPVVALGLRFGF